MLSQELLPLREGGFGCHQPGGEHKFPGLWVGRLPWAPVPTLSHRTRTKVWLEAGSRREGGLRSDLSTKPGRSLRAGHTHRESRKPPYPSSVFDLVDPQLHGHVKAVKDVSAEHQRVYGGVDRMDPAWGGRETEGQPPAPACGRAHKRPSQVHAQGEGGGRSGLPDEESRGLGFPGEGSGRQLATPPPQAVTPASSSQAVDS